MTRYEFKLSYGITWLSETFCETVSEVVCDQQECTGGDRMRNSNNF